MFLAKKTTASVLALSLATLQSSCDSGVFAPSIETGVEARQPSVRLETSELLLLAGDTARITATVVSWNGSPVAGQAVSWSSSAPAVARVSGDGRISAVRTGEATLTATAGQASATARVRVSGATVAALTVSPEEYTASGVGETVRLTATAMDHSGAPVPEASVTWTSLDAAVATVGEDGRVTTHSSGVARITASSGGKTDTAKVSIRGVKTSVRLSPETAVLDAIGDTVRLVAAATDSRGNPVAASSLKWTSLSPGVATVDGDGLVTGRAVGVAMVMAENSGRADTSRIEVRQVVASVGVTPGAPVVYAGQTQQMVATARDANGNEIPGVAFGWASSNTPVATVDGAGLARALAAGTSYVTASAAGKSGTATLTVTADPGTVPARVVVAPETVTLEAIGAAAQLGATVYSAAGGAMSGAPVSWTSLDGGVASVDGAGKVVARANGTARVVAASGTLSDTATVVVRQAVASVSVSPSAPTVEAGQTQQLAASARDANGHAVAGASFAWASSNPAVATVDGSGLVRTIEAGVSYITASAEGKSGTATLTVTAAPVVAAPVATVSVTPASASIVVGGSVLLTATARDAAGNLLTGRAVSWSSSNPAVATVSASGMVTGAGTGSATITATVEGKTGTASVTVSDDPATLVGRVVVSPAADTLNAVAATVQLGATVYSEAGSSMTGAEVAWSSLDAGVATVDAAGKVTAKAAGTARIVAASGGVSDTARVLVRQLVASVAVSPSAPTVQPGQTQQLAATARDANGYAISGVTFGWTSSNTAAATVNGAGLVTGVAAGVSYVTASAGGKSAVAKVTVEAAPVASVAVSPATPSISVGGTVDLDAVAKDVSGNVLTGRAVTWATSNTGIATVSSTGLVTGMAGGTVTITATSEGKSGAAQVTVTVPVSGSSLAFQDAFDSGALTAPNSAGYRWRLPSADASSKVSVSQDIARSGSSSLKFLYGGDSRLCDDAWAEQRFEMGQNLQEVWFEYYIYIPKGTEGLGPKFVHRQPTQKNSDGSCSSQAAAATNNKFFALWDTIYDKAKGGDVRVLVEYRRTSLAGEGDSNLYGMWGTDTRTAGHYNQAGSRWDPAFTDALRGRWAQVRIRARVADSKEAANGVVQIWVDGALRVNMQGLDLAPEPGGARFFRNGYLMGWSNSGFSQSTAVYVDDFKIFRSNPGW